MTEAELKVDELVRREFNLGASESGTLGIAHAKDPRLPQFAFEWHPKTQKVYRADVPGRWTDGVYIPSILGKVVGYCIAEHCLTHAQFLGFVQTFCRGYLMAVVHNTTGNLGTNAPPRILETDPCPVR